jgi:mono/diheme cytochrome c family protein
MKIVFSAFVIGLFACTLALAAQVDGKKVYASKCASCHGVKATGIPGIAKAKKVDPSALDLTKAATTKKPAADLVNDVLKGTRKMLPQKVTQAEADALAKYIAGLGVVKK